MAWRPAAARLVAELALDVDGTRELARAIVDYERRPDETRSFQATPGDALAYKIWRDAGEVPRRLGWREAVEKCVARGLALATSESGKARLRSRLEEDTRSLVGGAGGAAAGATRVAASAQVVRLEDEEAAFRALPLLGMLDEVTPSQLRLAPSAACEGVFRAFRPAGGVAWVALPAWAKMQKADSAVVLQIADTRTLTVAPSIANTIGPALLVVDRADVTPQDEHFYIVAKAASALLMGAGGRPLPQKLELAAGGAVPAGAAVLGRLALVVRPPGTVTGSAKNLPKGLRDLGIADDDGVAPDEDELAGPYTLGSKRADEDEDDA